MHTHDVTREARAREVEQGGVGITALTIGRADDRHRSGRQKSSEVRHAIR